MRQSPVEEGIGLELVTPASLHVAADGQDGQRERQQRLREASEEVTAGIDLSNLVKGLPIGLPFGL